MRDDGWHYAVNWLLTVRDGSTIEISGTRRTRAELDALVVDLITALGWSTTGRRAFVSLIRADAVARFVARNGVDDVAWGPCSTRSRCCCCW